MTELTHNATGHKVRIDDASVDFWKSAGYVEAAKPAPAKKAPAKKSASSKSEK